MRHSHTNTIVVRTMSRKRTTPTVNRKLVAHSTSVSCRSMNRFLARDFPSAVVVVLSRSQVILCMSSTTSLLFAVAAAVDQSQTLESFMNASVHSLSLPDLIASSASVVRVLAAVTPGVGPFSTVVAAASIRRHSQASEQLQTNGLPAKRSRFTRSMGSWATSNVVNALFCSETSSRDASAWKRRTGNWSSFGLLASDRVCSRGLSARALPRGRGKEMNLVINSASDTDSPQFILLRTHSQIRVVHSRSEIRVAIYR